ncbi:MAG: 50S ribosomal protein L22 [Anaerolineales bacterium]|nr:MAG: 50S ribosomal protein L22 [Anaerolineales bacterium]
MDVHAKVRYVSIAPQKVRLVLDLVRGKPVNEAMLTLRFLHKAAAQPVYKLIRSAVANAEENLGLNRDDLMVHSIFADQGPTRNWRRFGARGRFKPLRKRASHITVILREQETITT